MNWDKQGKLFDPADSPEWISSHAMLPVPYWIRDDRYRIFFAGRDERNMSQIGFVDVSIPSPNTIHHISESPVITTGDLGLFDDSGVFPTAIVEIDGDLYLYYVGWMRAERIRYFGSLGVAVSSDNGASFTKVSSAPLLPRNDVDPYMTLSSFVMKDDGTYKLWYTSAKSWETMDGETVPLCHIKYAESSDGLNWRRNGKVSIALEEGDETRIARPTVLKGENSWHMWYSCASGLGGYDIGYAESGDGVEWSRKDDMAGIETSSRGWDSEMLAYPYVFSHDGDTYLLYNGNGYGETGIGYAILR